MKKVLLIGADVHDKNILTKFAVDRDEPRKRSFSNTRAGRAGLMRWFQKCAEEAGADRIVFAYEASGAGFGLYDVLTEARIGCHVLAPSKIERSAQQRRRKTDERDAQQIFETLRGHVLAGNELPAVWIPDLATRDDRDLVRARLDAGEKCAKVKTQVQTLLKRNGVEKPGTVGRSWTKTHRAWLKTLAAAKGRLASGAVFALASLLRQLAFLEKEVMRLDRAMEALWETPRYRTQARALMAMPGVGVLTALVFLTEIGDARRFENRRQLGAYLGLAPSSHESGEQDDRKGHITRQGSGRLRKVLCQATWSRIRSDAGTGRLHARLVKKNPKKKKIATVACMRHLGIRMWHEAVRAGRTG